MEENGKCPVSHGSNSQHSLGSMSNNQWWPDQLNLSILHQHDQKSDPMDKNFDYIQGFYPVFEDMNELIAKLDALIGKMNE